LKFTKISDKRNASILETKAEGSCEKPVNCCQRCSIISLNTVLCHTHHC